jgi:hypothetical protein
MAEFQQDDDLFFDPSAEEEAGSPTPAVSTAGAQAGEAERIVLEKKREFLERFLLAWQNKKSEKRSA